MTSCYLCNSLQYFLIYLLDADIYEESIGIKDDRRQWFKCDRCGLYFQENILTDNDLREIYQEYRNVSMRKTTVKEEFDRIINIQYSENKNRVAQLVEDGFVDGVLLDIGSGLGVFPYEIEPYVSKIHCIEPNRDSAQFIESLGFNCYPGYYKSNIFKKKFDLISVIHVLEHQRDPIKFLSDIAIDLNENGKLYIEVPDAIEFEYLDRYHDEFNSCHLYMFDVSTLDRICRKAGFLPYLIRRVKYGERRLSRIQLLAKYHQ